MRIDVSVRRTDMSFRMVALVPTEWMCLFETAASVPTEQMCLFGMSVPILIEQMCLL